MEENPMEINDESVVQEQEKPVYHPRPVWQIVAAWVGLAIVITGVILYYIHIARGGM